MALTPQLVSRCFRVEPEVPSRFVRANDSDFSETIERLLAQHHGSLWVFAYGSLIWKPCFVPVELQRGAAIGWHRAFSLKMERFRGSPEFPGLMMVLARGGRCNGLLMRVEDGTEGQVISDLLRRELPNREFLRMARWISVESNSDRVRALVFWAGRFPPLDASGISDADAARMIATACGHVGSCAEYLYETVVALEKHGIRDRNLWRLQALVAAEVSKRDLRPI